MMVNNYIPVSDNDKKSCISLFMGVFSLDTVYVDIGLDLPSFQFCI